MLIMFYKILIFYFMGSKYWYTSNIIGLCILNSTKRLWFVDHKMINNVINLILILNYDLKEGFYRATDKNTNKLKVLFVSCCFYLSSTHNTQSGTWIWLKRLLDEEVYLHDEDEIHTWWNINIWLEHLSFVSICKKTWIDSCLVCYIYFHAKL